MKMHAQEFSEQVLFQHVDLYVNQWTLDLGVEGEQAIKKLNELAKQKIQISDDEEIKIFKPSK